MTKHDQANIIQEQMQANKRIIKAAVSGQFAVRSPLSERIKQYVRRDATSSKSPSRPPKSE